MRCPCGKYLCMGCDYGAGYRAGWRDGYVSGYVDAVMGLDPPVSLKPRIDFEVASRTLDLPMSISILKTLRCGCLGTCDGSCSRFTKEISSFGLGNVSVSSSRSKKCPRCCGSRRDHDGYQYIFCVTCNGSGEVSWL